VSKEAAELRAFRDEFRRRSARRRDATFLSEIAKHDPRYASSSNRSIDRRKRSPPPTIPNQGRISSWAKAAARTRWRA
jgi:hypothetical protein